MIYGYARVSTKGQAVYGNSLESQEEQLRANGAEVIYKEATTGTKLCREELDKLMQTIQPGDTFMVTKLDRFARSMTQASDMITELINRGIRVHVLNLGILDNTSASVLVRNIFLSFAQFERDMIVERCAEGKAVAKQNPEYHEGRPVTYSKKQKDLALKLLENHTYKEVEEMTGISKSTLIREKRNRAV